MRRRLLVILSLLALVLAAASPALAQGKAVGKPERVGQPEQVQNQESQPEPLGLKGKAFQGAVTAKGESTLTVHSDKYNAADKNFTVNVVDGETKIKVPGLKKIAELKDIAVNDRVVVQLQNKPGGAVEGNLGDARAIHVVPGQNFIHVTGELVAAGGGVLTIGDAQGQQRSFAIGDDTVVRDGKEMKRLRDYTLDKLDDEIGRKVTVVARVVESGNPPALAIVLHGNVDKDQQQATNDQQGQSDDEDDDDQDDGNGPANGRGKDKGKGND